MQISDKNLKLLVVGVSILIPAVVTVLAFLPALEMSEETMAMIKQLPKLNATINGTAFFTLIAAWFAIKNKNVGLHRKLTTFAIVLSVAFLLSYITYHFSTEPTLYCKDYKGLYFFILITHIVLSAVIVPLVLYTYARGHMMQVEKHRKLAKITWPLWLYVTATGVIVYFMLDGCPPPQ